MAGTVWAQMVDKPCPKPPPCCDLPQKVGNKTCDYKTLRDKKGGLLWANLGATAAIIIYSPDVTSECQLWVGRAVATGAQGPGEMKSEMG